MGPAIEQIIIDLRTALVAAGEGRAAGVIDVPIAATTSPTSTLGWRRDGSSPATRSTSRTAQSRLIET
jgi:hypothetical protein